MFLREYDKLAGQCAAEGAAHPDYLLRLSELELIDRHHRTSLANGVPCGFGSAPTSHHFPEPFLRS
jgi:hypothetical protein